jgi:hypothetical protein
MHLPQLIRALGGAPSPLAGVAKLKSACRMSMSPIQSLTCTMCYYFVRQDACCPRGAARRSIDEATASPPAAPLLQHPRTHYRLCRGGARERVERVRIIHHARGTVCTRGLSPGLSWLPIHHAPYQAQMCAVSASARVTRSLSVFGCVCVSPMPYRGSGAQAVCGAVWRCVAWVCCVGDGLSAVRGARHLPPGGRLCLGHFACGLPLQIDHNRARFSKRRARARDPRGRARRLRHVT